MRADAVLCHWLAPLRFLPFGIRVRFRVVGVCDRVAGVFQRHVKLPRVAYRDWQAIRNRHEVTARLPDLKAVSSSGGKAEEWLAVLRVEPQPRSYVQRVGLRSVGIVRDRYEGQIGHAVAGRVRRVWRQRRWSVLRTPHG